MSTNLLRDNEILRNQVVLLANIINKLSAASDFRKNDDGSYRYPDNEPVLGRDEGTLTRGDIRFARTILNNSIQS